VSGKIDFVEGKNDQQHQPNQRMVHQGLAHHPKNLCPDIIISGHAHSFEKINAAKMLFYPPNGLNK
jgi:predicted phosphodiesterase